MKAVGSLPLKFHLRCGKAVGKIVGGLLGYRRDVVMTNLSRSFPTLKYAALSKIRKDFYTSLGYIFAEALWFGASNAKRLRKQKIVQIANPEEMQKAYDGAPGVVVMDGHFGNWELYGGIQQYNFTDRPFPATEKNTVVVYKEMANHFWDEILRDNRLSPLKDKKKFEGYIEGGNVVRYMFSHRDEKKIYVFNTDQSPYSQSPSNIDLEFLHQPTRTMTACASVAHKFGFAVVYSSMRRASPGEYSITYTTICPDASKMSVEDITKQFYALLQTDIEEQPANYIWSHKRWKMDVQL